MAFFPAALQSQLSRVLRLSEGDVIEVLDGSGLVYQAELGALTNGQLAARLLSQAPSSNEPHTLLTLHIALTQREKFEWILQKGTEVGISAFQPFIAARSLVQQEKIPIKKMVRWKEILREAAEQSHRGLIPEIDDPVPFEQSLCKALSSQQFVMAACVGDTFPDLKTILKTVEGAKNHFHLFIGPEGGFNSKEMSLMIKEGVKPFNLGRRILRMETAAIVASALILFQSGDI